MLFNCGVGKTLESPLGCKMIKPINPKGNPSWIFIGRLMLKLKLQYFGHLMRRTDWLEKTLMLGKIEGNRGWDVWMASLTQWTWVWVSSGSWWWTGKPGVLQFMRTQRVGHDWASELNWTGVRNKDLVRRWKKEKTQEKNAVNPGAKQLWTVLVHLHVGFIFQY